MWKIKRHINYAQLFVSIVFGLTYNCIKYMYLNYCFQITFYFFEKLNLEPLLLQIYKA